MDEKLNERTLRPNPSLAKRLVCSGYQSWEAKYYVEFIGHY